MPGSFSISRVCAAEVPAWGARASLASKIGLLVLVRVARRWITAVFRGDVVRVIAQWTALNDGLAKRADKSELRKGPRALHFFRCLVHTLRIRSTLWPMHAYDRHLSLSFPLR